MKINSFFCGAGGFDLGFIQAGFEVVGAWDFDKYAVESYKHNIGNHVKEMSVLDMKGSDVPKANGWLFGFPCQDISVAGKQAGMVKGETRSGLFYEIMRLLGEVSDKPEWILAENVKAVNKFIPTIREEYERAGYKIVDPKLYNSKFWWVPQNRERYFLMGVREDVNVDFIFPTQQTDFIPKLSSVLESEVDEKYYISDEKAAKIIEQAIEGLKVKQATKKGYDIAVEGDSINISHPNSKTRRGRVGKQVAQTLLTGQEQVVVLKDVHACITPDRVDKRQNGRRAKDNEEEMFTLTSQDLHGVIIDPSHAIREGKHRIYDQSSPTLNARDYKDPRMVIEQPEINRIGGLFDKDGKKKQAGGVFDKEGLSPTLKTPSGGYSEPMIVEEGTGEIEVVGRLGMFTYRSLDEVHDTDGVSPCLTTSEGGHRQPKILERYRVRKLTPREYARLQGFPDSYEQVVSNSQFYKQMGNAVTVNVSHAIAKAIKEQFHDLLS